MNVEEPSTQAVISDVLPGGEKGRWDLELVIYLPPDFGGSPQYSVNRSAWKSFPAGTGDFHRALVPGLAPDTEIRSRYRDGRNRWRLITPSGGLENLNGRHFVAPNDYVSRFSARRTGNARVCMESTLEGMLAGYQAGCHAPQELQDLLPETIAARMLRAKMPARLAGMEIDEVMAPVFPSVADRSNLNPKFNYLIYAVGSVDWQIAQPHEFQALVDALHEHGISFVPDMIFAHFVKNPHEGAPDQVIRETDGKRLYVDHDAYYFRDYGTWMFDLANPAVRRLIVERITRFVVRNNLSAIRVDFVDGIILQYSKRPENFGETLLRELARALREAAPALTIVGEAFSTADNPAARELIHVNYCPRGFTVAEEIYKPPKMLPRPSFPDIDSLAGKIRNWAYGEAREAVYAQLHDEAWQDEHIRAGRPDVPWAYGAHPAQLALDCGEQLVEMKELDRRDMMDFVRRRVRGVEALTMFLSNLRYIYLPAVDSLALGRFDDPQRWMVAWDLIAPQDMKVWMKTRLPEVEIFKLHDQHWLDMKTLRGIYRRNTPVDEDRRRPLTRISVFHSDGISGVLGIERRHVDRPQEAMLAVFNFGFNRFRGEMRYQLPVPEDLKGRWKVLFDGDARAAGNLRAGEESHGLPAGTELNTGTSDFTAGDRFLRLPLGANSLTIVQHV